MQLTLYMLRPGLPRDTWAARRGISKFTPVKVRPVGQLDISLSIQSSAPKPPRWIDEVLPLVDGPTAEVTTKLLGSYCSALFRIRYKGYKFLLAYGGAHHTIDRGFTEPGFGLHVVANSVASNQVISADTRRFDGRGRNQRVSMAAAGPLYELGIEPTEQIIRQLEGKPAADFASGAAGSDSLKLRLRDFSLSNLECKLDQIIEQFEADTYKQTFGFLDYFVRVPREDKVLCSRLNLAVERMIEERSKDLAFAAPEMGEPLAIDHYVLSASKRQERELASLLPDDIFDCIEEWQVRDPLRKIQVVAVNSADEIVGDIHKLHSYAVAEIPDGDRKFALVAGQWFQIDSNYEEAVQRRIDSIPDLTTVLSLPPWTKAYKEEGDYNLAASANRSWALLDKDNFYGLGGPNQKIEVCDLLTADKKLICVKKMERSSTLSHLFAQGQVSGQLLAADVEGYRDKVMGALRSVSPGSDFGLREDWTIVYAFATEKAPRISQALYFFSKVNLDRTVPMLRPTGINVALAKIDLKV